MNRSHLRANIIIVAGILAAAAAPGLIAADLPKAETILDKFVEVTGGKAAYAKVHSQIESGTFELPAMGIKGTMISYRAGTRSLLYRNRFPGIGKMQIGTDGKVAWTNNPCRARTFRRAPKKLRPC